MNQKGEYIYEITNYNNIDKIRISIIDNNESYAKSKAISLASSLPLKSGSGWYSNTLTLVEIRVDNLNFSATQVPDWFTIRDGLASIEQNIRELNERGKKAIL